MLKNVVIPNTPDVLDVIWLRNVPAKLWREVFFCTPHITRDNHVTAYKIINDIHSKSADIKVKNFKNIVRLRLNS